MTPVWPSPNARPPFNLQDGSNEATSRLAGVIPAWLPSNHQGKEYRMKRIALVVAALSAMIATAGLMASTAKAVTTGSLTMNAGSDSLLSGMQDSRRIIAHSIQKFSINRQQWACFNEWDHQCQATEVMIYAVQGRFGKALSSWLRGLRRDPRFFVTFVHMGLLAVGRRLRTWWRLRK